MVRSNKRSIVGCPDFKVVNVDNSRNLIGRAKLPYGECPPVNSDSTSRWPLMQNYQPDRIQDEVNAFDETIAA